MASPLVLLILGLLVLTGAALLFFPRGGLLGRWKKNWWIPERVLREDALKHIHAAEAAGRAATLQSIAGALEIGADRAAQLVAELTEAELVATKGDALYLTPEGRNAARRIVRAHRLWERQLADETGYPEDEWHQQAERWEHDLTAQEVQDLAAHLGNPTHDPHGDPIPSPEGEIAVNGGKPLTDLPLGVPARIVHIEDEPQAIYTQLVAEGLYPGMRVQVLERTPQGIRLRVEDGEHLLSQIAAANIAVAPLPADLPIQQVGEPLAALKPGESGMVVGISRRCRGVERRRLMDLGVLPGTVVRAEFVSPSGDPTAFSIRGALIALRQEQSRLISVKRLGGAG